MAATYSGPSLIQLQTISKIAGYVNYHANRIYNVSLYISTAVSFVVMLSIVSANHHISACSALDS